MTNPFEQDIQEAINEALERYPNINPLRVYNVLQAASTRVMLELQHKNRVSHPHSYSGVGEKITRE